MNKKLLALLIVVLLVGSFFVIYPYSSLNTNHTNTPNIAEVSDVNWVKFEGEGYEIMHPGYEVRDQGSYDVIAYIPEVIGGYPNISIQVVEVESIDGYIGEYISNAGTPAGISIDSPGKAIKTDIEGFAEAYIYEYDSDWAKDPGLYRLLFLKSLHNDDKWAIIQFPVVKNAVEMVDSFKFVE